MRAIILAVLLASALPGEATAQTLPQAWAWCRDHDPDTLIRGCSAIIRSGRETPENLARAYFNRGRAWSDRGEYARAMQDFDEAIKLDPNYPDALNSRALAWRGLGQDARAMADFDLAIKLDPEYAIALFNRGLTEQALGAADDGGERFRQGEGTPALG